MTKVAIKRKWMTRAEFELEAKCSRKLKGKQTPCGAILVEYYHPLELNGEPIWNVAHIEVEPGFRRQGIATKLYEAAAREGCRRDAIPLGSTSRTPNSESNQFWAKQFAKGRAVRYRSAYPGMTPDVFVLKHCAITALDGVQKSKTLRHRSARRQAADLQGATRRKTMTYGEGITDLLRRFP